MTWTGRGSTRQWRQLRARILMRDPVCQLQLAGCTNVSTQADHIIAVVDGGTDHPANLRGLCKPCHDKVTAKQSVAGRAKAKPAKANRARPQERHPGAL